MNLGNSFEVIVHHLLIGEMVDLDHRDEVPMASTILCMFTHWIGLIVSHDIKVSSSHDFTKFLYCIISQP